MIDVKESVNGLICSIYECQKQIIMNRRFIRELLSEEEDASRLQNETKDLEDKIIILQKELKERFKHSY
jgi:hypothetical protein